MRKDKESATILRRSGRSYKEIERELRIPRATLSDWFRDLDWSKEIKDALFETNTLVNKDKVALMVAANKRKSDLLHEQYRKEAIEEFSNLKKDPLFIAGIMLYWGEGVKNVSGATIKLANSDMDMIRTFYIFLVNTLKIPKEKIVINLLLYPDLVDSVQKKTWSVATGIPLMQFRKSVFIIGRHPTTRLSHGVGNIRVGGRRYIEKIIKWIELFMRETNSAVVA